jgi:uncharacterized protein YrrD
MVNSPTLPAPRIALGDEVWGRDEKLGEISRVIVDAGTDRVTDIVVKRGGLMSHEYVVPLSWVFGREEGVNVSLTVDALEAMPGFSDERYRAADPDYSGPPGFDARAEGNAHLQMNSIVAFGPLLAYGTSTPVGGFPGGEVVDTGRMARPVIETGEDVLDCNGEKVGEVYSFESDSDGNPRSLIVRKGFIFHDDLELPAGWIDDLSDKGVVLNVPKATVERVTVRD